MNLREYIRDIPDYPKPGITFFDITPILMAPEAFRYTIDQLAATFAGCGANKIVAADARGFIFGAPLAVHLGMGFIPVRKPGKLPYETICASYELEYGTDTLNMHIDAVGKGDKVLVIDDLLATGGTAGCMAQLVEESGGELVGMGFVVELGFLDGGAKLNGIPYSSLLTL